ncbi:MAG TPA: hypothetical protein VK475_12500 [Pyrinomonadaceae bacterium]|nr:hypothetical protein [Pyrinomonadaceae bacterium]
MNHSTSQRSWRQNLAQGGASKVSGTLGRGIGCSSARFSGRKNLSPAKAGLGIFFGTIPGAALRFTSFRFAYPGLNSAAGYAGSVSLMLLLLTIACSKKEVQTVPSAAGTGSPAPVATPTAGNSPAPSVENYPALQAQAQEVNDAFRRRDFAHMVDLTYPKVIESAGGRDKMIAALAQGIKEMETEGVSVISSTAEAPIQIVHVAQWIYAVVPTTLKVKAKDGVFKTESSMIGISSDRGVNWTFIDAGGKDHTQLKNYLPAPADALKLPGDKEPVKISEN